MVLGWRRAFCTSIPKDRVKQQQQHCNSDTNANTNSSNPSTPRLPASSPTLRCRTSSSSVSVATSPTLHSRASSSTETPRSPSTFSLLKSTLRLSTKRSRCGICSEPAKSGQGTAIFTAECSHLFHFPCIAAHFKTHQSLLCPVCNTAWKDLPLIPHSTDAKPKSLRVYNDDEPLISPSSAARFNPIPEEDENDEPTEFQGFFVRPTSSDSPKSIGHNRSDVEVDLGPEAALLAVGRGFETCVVKMRVKAPPAGRGGARRPPIDFVAVVEVSAAMNGAKLETVKRAMRLVVSSLSESDRLSIVAFSATSKRLLPLRRMTATGRRSARWVVDALNSTSTGALGMCVGDAVKKAAKVIDDRRQKNSAAGIVLFSDGRTNQFSSISSTRLPHVDAPVHNVSIGACDDAPSDASLAKCLTGLLSVVVQDLRLQLGFVSGSGQAQVSGVYSVTGKPGVLGSGQVRLGDLFAEEERELLVELKVAAGSHQILTVRPSFMDTSSGAHAHSKEHALVVPRPQAVRSSSSSSTSIKRLRNLHVTVRAVAESRRLIEHDDLSGAHHLLSSARALLMKSSSGSSEEELLSSLEAEQAELQRRRLVSRKQSDGIGFGGKRKEKSEPTTPTSSWRAAERLAKVAIMRKSMNRVSDLHGFQNAGF